MKQYLPWNPLDRLNGITNETGFAIKFGRETIATTKGYDPQAEVPNEQVPRLFLISFLFQVLVFSVVLGTCTSNPVWVNVLWGFGMAIPFFASSSTIAAILDELQQTRIREYHGCEHKVIDLIFEGLEVTPENLKKMPKTSWFCGVVLGTMVVSSIFFLGIITFLFFGNVRGMDPPGSLVVFVSVILLLLWAFVLPFLTELCVVKDPPDTIVEEGTIAAQIAYQNLHKKGVLR